MRYIHEYLNEIAKGRIVVSKAVETQYKRLIPILDGKHDRYVYNDSKGHRPIEFAERFCMQTKGEWAAQKLELLLFQKAKFEAIFGIVHRETGYRKHREVFDLRARKNGKSTEQSAMALFMLTDEPGAEIYSAATVMRQAKKVWEPAAAMIEKSRELQGKFKVNQSKNEILLPYNFGRYIPLSKNYKDFDGDNVQGAIIDELHVVERGMYDVLKQGSSSRRQPLISMITTRGTEESDLFKDKYEEARNIVNGVFENDAYFVLLYELEEGDNWHEKRLWHKANPALDVIKFEMDSFYNTALMDKGFTPTFKTKDLNIQAGSYKSWIEPHYIVHNEKTFDTRKKTNAIGGFDLSISNDLTCFTILTYNRLKDEFEADNMYWIPEDRLEVNDSLSKQFRQWIAQGWLRISGKDIISYHDIAKYVYDKAMQDEIIFNWIYYDPFSAVYLVDEFRSMGFSDMCLQKCAQTYKNLSTPMQMLEADVKSKKINFNNNPITKWCFTNVSVKTDVMGNMLPEKHAGQRNRKIDGMATILNCYVGLNEHLREFTQL